MNIFIMRHGEAEILAADDSQRQLTDIGKRQADTQGQWLKTRLKSTALRLDKVIVSPYVRTQQTFDGVNAAFSSSLTALKEDWQGITPHGNVQTVTDYLAFLAQEGCQGVLLISHLPLVGEITAELYGKRNPISFYPATIAQLNWQGNAAATIETHQYPPALL